MENHQIRLIMPLGSNYGWGVCGKYLSMELSEWARVKVLAGCIEIEEEEAPEDYDRLSKLYQPLESLKDLQQADGRYTFENPVVQTIQDADLKPWLIEATAPTMVGYTFFEKSFLEKQNISNAAQYYDRIVAGSSWCENILKDYGLKNTSTIIQGVDTDRFNPSYAEKKKFADRFVIFSGGKIEFRKGQDLVIKALKVMQDRHDDVLLVNCWFNRWDASTSTMAMSPHIRFEMPPGDYFHAINHLLQANGIDADRVITLPPLDNGKMGEVYQNTDCGLFPNRCEGGTNLVLMEYMACGKPTIASYNSGHTDVLSDRHSFLLKEQQPLTIRDSTGKFHTTWYESNLEEIIHHLEWAYQNRDHLKEKGLAGADFIKSFTWGRSAEQFYQLLFPDKPIRTAS